MRKRLVIAAVCILALPLLYSVSQTDKTTSPYATVALAGHTTMGNWCDCGTPGCICGLGELGLSSKPAPPKASSDGKGVNQRSAPDVDVASGMLTLALAFLVLVRMR